MGRTHPRHRRSSHYLPLPGACLTSLLFVGNRTDWRAFLWQWLVSYGKRNPQPLSGSEQRDATWIIKASSLSEGGQVSRLPVLIFLISRTMESRYRGTAGRMGIRGGPFDFLVDGGLTLFCRRIHDRDSVHRVLRDVKRDDWSFPPDMVI
ncbi:hypothetical protein C8R46DRAFT_309096 [Mycena filopes]|nr:hypothetical protein C8R46DRAFT_309096 [Mycena filopes]